MKSIKDPAETRKIEGYKNKKETWIKNMFGDLVDLTPEEQKKYRKNLLKKAVPTGENFYDDDGNREFIGVENEDPILTEEDFASEELWRKGTAVLSDAGPEEDETREPQPDEPEEYWINIAEDIIKKSRVLLFFAADKRYSRALEQRYYRQLTDNIIMLQLTMDNFIRRLKGEVK
jgi:hypothetical protein